MKKFIEKLLIWLWLKEPPKHKAGDITLYGKNGELNVAIKSIYTDWR